MALQFHHLRWSCANLDHVEILLLPFTDRKRISKVLTDSGKRDHDEGDGSN